MLKIAIVQVLKDHEGHVSRKVMLEKDLGEIARDRYGWYRNRVVRRFLEHAEEVIKGETVKLT